jgi:cell division protein FtsQ
VPKPPEPRKIRWRLWFGIAAWSAVFISTAYATKKVQHFMLSDRRFSLAEDPGISVEGLRYTSRARVLQVFTPDFGLSTFHVPLAERRRRLLAIDWVRRASVSRVWPNRIIVHLEERRPVAFVNLPTGPSGQFRYSLIDSDGVLLSPPQHVRFDYPVLKGVTEEQKESERRERVLAMQALLAELGSSAKQISEVNAANVEDMRITTQLDHQAVELWMGDRNFSPRFQNFMNHYPEIRRQSTETAIFDLRLDDRITTK